MLNSSLFADKKSVAVALSGGKDSVVLLHMLLEKRRELNIEVKAVNVEHGIRGESSLADTRFVKELCKGLNVELKTFSVDAVNYSKNNRLSLENGARALRYQCFLSAVEQGFCDCVATAHHQSDNAETVFLNFLRGSSVSGLCGIKDVGFDGKIIRPILHLEKSEIESYVLAHGLTFVTDESNFSSDYTRNFLRNEAFPLLKTRFPALEQSVLRLSEIASKEDEFLNGLALQLIDKNCVTIPDEKSEVLFKRACLLVIKQLGFGVNYEKSHLDALWNLTKLETGSKTNLKSPLVAYKSYNKICFELQHKINDNLEIPFTIGSALFNNYTLFFEKSEPIARLNDDNALFFDLDKLPQDCVIRCRKTGDVITAFGNKTKSLKKYFTDKKIDARTSKHLPLIAKDNVVYAVLGVDISENIKIDKSSLNVIKFTYTKGE